MLTDAELEIEFLKRHINSLRKDADRWRKLCVLTRKCRVVLGRQRKKSRGPGFLFESIGGTKVGRGNSLDEAFDDYLYGKQPR